MTRPRLNGFLASVVAPIVAWLVYDAVRVRNGWSSTSSDLRAASRRHPWRCGGVLAYFVLHIIGDLLLPAWARRLDLLAYGARRLEPKAVTIVVDGTPDVGASKRALDADRAELLDGLQVRARRSVA